MQAREYIKLLLEDAGIANVTHLGRVDGYMLMPLLSLLFSQDLSILRVLFELLLEVLDLRVVLI